MVDYAQLPRLDWICKWQGQVVLAGNQTMWTAQVESAIEANGLAVFGANLHEELLKTVT